MFEHVPPNPILPQPLKPSPTPRLRFLMQMAAEGTEARWPWRWPDQGLGCSAGFLRWRRRMAQARGAFGRHCAVTRAVAIEGRHGGGRSREELPAGGRWRAWMAATGMAPRRLVALRGWDEQLRQSRGTAEAPLRARMPRPESSVSSCLRQKKRNAECQHACVRHWNDKSMLAMS